MTMCWLVLGTEIRFMQVVFATCEQNPLTTADDQVLVDALAARGVEVTPIPWTEIDPYAVIGAPPIVLRSTWDYHRVPTMFVSWLDALADSGRMTINPPEVARGNVDKIYLQALETSGIAIPNTRWLDRADNDTLARVMNDEGWERAVLKPRIAATAYGTFLITAGQALSDDDLAPARSSGALLQAVVPEIVERGETSIVYAGGAYSHAVIKRAKDGEFRVQKDFGGRVEPASPPPALLSFASTVMTHVPDTCLYARVDVVETTRGPLLMELELIEPELYFVIVPDAADRMAHLIADRLS
jgi:glutathione synthase/RimK-type ligase-like ATP-grasp enzyme